MNELLIPYSAAHVQPEFSEPYVLLLDDLFRVGSCDWFIEG